MKSIDIICPVFREDEVIADFHARLSAVADGIGARYAVSIIYVLDPSPDRTEEVLSGLSRIDPRVKVLVMARRFGHQAAIIAGMDHSHADAVVMLDSDLQHPPELIPELIKRWEDGAEIVQTLRQDGAETGFAKRVTSKLFYRLMKIGSIDLRTGAADYRLLSGRVVDVFREQMREHNPFLRGLIGWVGFNINYVAFQPDPRLRGKSKYKISTLFNFALNGICSFSILPLRICMIVGLSIAALSFLSVVVQLTVYLFGSTVAPGWASQFTMTSLVGGIQLVFLGILGEYVGLIFDEVKNRPRYLIDLQYQSGKSVRVDRRRQIYGLPLESKQEKE
jgi:glycosyltransferase involved in cell wall biosynthesis